MDEIESKEEKLVKIPYDDKCFRCQKIIKENEFCVENSININGKKCNVSYRHIDSCPQVLLFKLLDKSGKERSIKNGESLIITQDFSVDGTTKIVSAKVDNEDLIIEDHQ